MCNLVTPLLSRRRVLLAGLAGAAVSLGAHAAERSAAELVAGMDASWQFMQVRLDRWTPTDLARTFPHDEPEWRDKYVTARSWVVWHVLEHDLHHGGEISLTLGMHGLQAPEM